MCSGKERAPGDGALVMSFATPGLSHGMFCASKIVTSRSHTNAPAAITVTNNFRQSERAMIMGPLEL